ncbi:hypothetical protein GCM10010191_48050 [Actinomadura vinacea]|uniref:Sigma-70 family RNA polymerase sigma factor n=1 Tax=Actinomadura vinacea TaxID=115336 RepID=A0ABN3JGG2_9ACTN
MSEAASNLPLAETSDAVLISRIRAGEVDAFGTLYERHAGAARRLARQLAEGEAAEDAVHETFAKILDVLRRGGGPRSGFRPYLLTAVRRTVYDRHRRERRLQSTDRIEMYDPGVPFVDPALEGLERSMVARAFQSLPERWQAVLWHTEIEGAKPADVGPLLGLSPNGVAALAYRAREGLRQAYLQMHLDDPSAGSDPGATAAAVDGRCRPVLDMLGAYVRGGLARRDSRTVERHLDGCERCKGIHAELTDVNTALRDAVGPLVLGTASVAFLAAKSGVTAGGAFGWWPWLRWVAERRTGMGAGTAATAGAVALTMVLMAADHPIGQASPPMAVPSAAASRNAGGLPAGPPAALNGRPGGPLVTAIPSVSPGPSAAAPDGGACTPGAKPSRDGRKASKGDKKRGHRPGGRPDGRCGPPGRRLGTEHGDARPGKPPRGRKDGPPHSKAKPKPKRGHQQEHGHGNGNGHESDHGHGHGHKPRPR